MIKQQFKSLCFFNLNQDNSYFVHGFKNHDFNYKVTIFKTIPFTEVANIVK